jgi:hypothetical protein
MSSSNPVLAPACFGASCDGFEISTFEIPRSDVHLLEKVQAFVCFEEVIRQHRLQLTNLTIQQAHASNVPVSSTASASEEANRVSSLLHDEFFSIALDFSDRMVLLSLCLLNLATALPMFLLSLSPLLSTLLLSGQL